MAAWQLRVPQAQGSAWSIAGATSSIVDGMLMVPDCPLWVAVGLPWAISVVGGMTAQLVLGADGSWPLRQPALAVVRWASVLGKASHLNLYPGQHSIVVCDNCSTHHTAAFKELILWTGAMLLCLLPYSLDLTR